jgi:hypothetical protein
MMAILSLRFDCPVRVRVTLGLEFELDRRLILKPYINITSFSGLCPAILRGLILAEPDRFTLNLALKQDNIPALPLDIIRSSLEMQTSLALG